MNDALNSRGSQTREALLKAAARIFGQAGFDAASTRGIAQAAGANQAMIAYHFGGKEGLYRAVFEAIAADMEQALSSTLNSLADQFNDVLPDSAEMRRQARQAIEQLLFVMLEHLGREDAADWGRLVVREQQDPTPAFEILYEKFMGPILKLLSRLVTLASGGAIQGEAARLRAVFLVAQILVFIYAPAAASRYLGWRSFDRPQRDTVRKQLRQMVREQFLEMAS